MVRFFLSAALGLIISCTASVPPPPAYQTASGQACGRECQSRYAACMENELRPDYLLMSPRKRACEKMLRQCYNGCLDGEKM